LSVSSAWKGIVDYAITQATDAVVLTGDVVDRDNRFFESYGPLKQGLSRLADCGIDIVAVAGNHDYEVFPHLVDALDAERFHLLGRGGTWDVVSLDRNASDAVRFVGWSFPTSHVRSSPIDSLELDRSDVPTIGLLHADLDEENSDYAPVRRSDLGDQPVDAWLLGHIHKPTLHATDNPLVLYPGSPQPLDPGEEGEHGPWLVEVRSSKDITARQVPLATVRYETIDVDVGGVEEKSEFRNAVVEAVEQAGKSYAGEDALQYLVCRLHCTGRTPIHRRLDAYWEETDDQEIPVGNRITAVIDGFHLDTRPDYDLGELSKRSDPPGKLAQVLLDLQNGQGHDDLLRQTRRELKQVNQAKKYGPLRRSSLVATPDSADEARELLMRQGLQLLDEMLAQKEDGTDE
jgi:DNA repair exonuclease SbcCD nuclease subunit